MLIHELCTQEAKPGALPQLLAQFRAEGLSLRDGRCGIFRGAWTTEFGQLNQLFTLWEHADAASCLAATEALHASADWMAHARACAPLLHSVSSTLLAPQRALGCAYDEGVVFDLREYDLQPYMGQTYSRMLAQVMPVRLGFSKNFCIWLPAAAQAHRLVHLWPYESIAQRLALRTALAAHPEWKAFVEQAVPMIVRQRSTLVRPVPGLLVR